MSTDLDLALVSSILHCSLALPDLLSFPTRRSSDLRPAAGTGGVGAERCAQGGHRLGTDAREVPPDRGRPGAARPGERRRSEEHTSELQSRGHLVCRLLLEKKKQTESTTL